MTDPMNPVDAEMAVLSGAFQSSNIADALHLTSGQFYDPAHGEMWDAIYALRARNITPDMPGILAHLGAKDDRANRIANLIMDMVHVPGIAANAPYHAEIVADRAERRRLLTGVIPGAQQRLNDLEQPLDEAVAFMEQGLAGTGGLDHEADALMTYDEFVGQDLPPLEWVIPDLLARGERLVVTGTEGAGKSTWLREIAVCSASGLHPLTLRTMSPRNVLVVDCENPNRIMINRFAEIGNVVTRAGRRPQNLSIRRFPQGIDLGRVEDRMRLRRLCQITQPDLLVIGPAYKMYLGGGNQREEDLARIVVSALDALREEFGFALILEHHQPKGSGGNRDAAPIGSSLWMRWPEFGLGLKLTDESDFNNRQAELIHWRGGRDDRPWPAYLSSGGPGELPWLDKVGMGIR